MSTTCHLHRSIASNVSGSCCWSLLRPPTSAPPTPFWFCQSASWAHDLDFPCGCPSDAHGISTSFLLCGTFLSAPFSVYAVTRCGAGLVREPGSCSYDRLTTFSFTMPSFPLSRCPLSADGVSSFTCHVPSIYHMQRAPVAVPTISLSLSFPHTLPLLLSASHSH